jgi:hypothetical protein
MSSATHADRERDTKRNRAFLAYVTPPGAHNGLSLCLSLVGRRVFGYIKTHATAATAERDRLQQVRRAVLDRSRESLMHAL